MADRNIQQAQKQQQATDAYIKSVAGGARRRDREGEGPARLRRDHAGRVRRDQGEGTRREPSAFRSRGAPAVPLGPSSRPSVGALGSSDDRRRRRTSAAVADPRPAQAPADRRLDRRDARRARRSSTWRGSTSGAGSTSSGTPSRRSRSATSSSAASSSACRPSLTALGWYGILRYAYPGGVTFMPVLASYATGVALNNFLPANIGTFVTLLMYVAIVQGATFPGVLAGYVVQKIFYFIIGTLIYIYLFLASPARSTSSSATRRTRSRTTPCSSSDHHRRRDLPDRDPAADLLGLGQEDVGQGEGGRGDPRRHARVREAACCCRRWAATPRR